MSVQHLKSDGIPSSWQEQLDCGLWFYKHISLFFSAVYSHLQAKHGSRNAKTIMRRGYIWNLIVLGDDRFDYPRNCRPDPIYWALQLEIFLWVIDPDWRFISKSWSQVPTVFSEKQLRAIEHGYMDEFLGRLIHMDRDIHECRVRLGFLIWRLADCTLFMTSDSPTVIFGKADEFVEQDDESFLLDGCPARSILRP
jgi:hypothetical protein